MLKDMICIVWQTGMIKTTSLGFWRFADRASQYIYRSS